MFLRGKLRVPVFVIGFSLLSRPTIYLLCTLIFWKVAFITVCCTDDLVSYNSVKEWHGTFYYHTS